jgi:hypothetical protein
VSTRPILLAAGLAAFLLVPPACRSTGTLDPRIYLQGRLEMDASSGGDSVRVTFLGTQGFLIKWRDRAVLTAPFYSNPPLLKLNEPIYVDEAEIERQLPGAWVADVEAILVGHSHYDHLMDVPYIALNKATKAKVYGSETMTRLLAPAFAGTDRLQSLSGKVDYRMCPGLAPCNKDNHGQEGEPVVVAGSGTTGTGVSVRALCSEHSPQFARLPTLWPGCRHQDDPALPSTAAGWVLGDTLAYLIDFVEDGRPVFRVYYQDSPTNRTLGYVHEGLSRKKPVDLDLLCAGAFDQVDDNPGGILRNTDPRYVLFGHWDDFFQVQSMGVRSLPATDVARLARRTQAALSAKPGEDRWWIPAPGAVFVFPVQP